MREMSSARRDQAIALGVMPAFVALMHARLAVEMEDGVPLGPPPLGILHFMVRDDAEAYGAAIEAGARAEWLAAPAEPDNPLEGWPGIVDLEDTIGFPFDDY